MYKEQATRNVNKWDREWTRTIPSHRCPKGQLMAAAKTPGPELCCQPKRKEVRMADRI